MSETFLDKIVAKTRERVAAELREGEPSDIRMRARTIRERATPHSFRNAIRRRDRNNIIAEIKRASPSKGVIKAGIDVAETARTYERGGAATISVLTETEYFGGSLADLFTVRQTVELPVLRKDFTVDVSQIFEAAAFGADAVLLIVAALSEVELMQFLSVVAELGMDAIVEVHTAAELATANTVGAEIIGINNRDLQSLAVSLDVSRKLIADRRENSLMIAESGLTTRAEVDELREQGFNGFLIGETLMRSGDPAAALEALV